LPAPDPRRQELVAWLEDLAAREPAARGLQPQSLRPASSDASFRRYFRIDCAAPVREAHGRAAGEVTAGSMIAMDAPPPHEDCRPYVHVAQLLQARGVNTPLVIASDIGRGFLLLSDLGTTTYADALAQPRADVAGLYADALAALVRLQQAPAGTGDAASGLPPYDRARLMAELRLFPDWYLARHFGKALEERERTELEAVFETLIEAALAQGQVLVHRDYHCRNLMDLRDLRSAGGRMRLANPGVLDFQDAVIGPVTYDLVSLLRDAYVEWPEDRQIDWAARYWDQARRAGLPVPQRFDLFWRDLEWMGLQRSLKVLGIFARLCYRDGKSRYLGDLPVVLRHTQRVAERYDVFSGLARLLDRVHERSLRSGYTF
jgi:hypothetical protein